MATRQYGKKELKQLLERFSPQTLLLTEKLFRTLIDLAVFKADWKKQFAIFSEEDILSLFSLIDKENKGFITMTNVFA